MTMLSSEIGTNKNMSPCILIRVIKLGKEPVKKQEKKTEKA